RIFFLRLISRRAIRMRLILPAPHAVSAGEQISQCQIEPAVEKEVSIPLLHDNLVLLTEITDNPFHRRRERSGLHARRSFAELIAAPSNFASATHSQALYLPQGHAEFRRKLRVGRAMREAIQEPLSMLGGNSQTDGLC